MKLKIVILIIALCGVFYILNSKNERAKINNENSKVEFNIKDYLNKPEKKEDFIELKISNENKEKYMEVIKALEKDSLNKMKKDLNEDENISLTFSAENKNLFLTIKNKLKEKEFNLDKFTKENKYENFHVDMIYIHISNKYALLINKSEKTNNEFNKVTAIYEKDGEFFIDKKFNGVITGSNIKEYNESLTVLLKEYNTFIDNILKEELKRKEGILNSLKRIEK